MHDLSKLIAGGQKVSTALAEPRGDAPGPRDQPQRDDGRLRRRGREPERDGAARCRSCSRRPRPALDNLNAAFPPTRAFAREILPGVRETPATIEAGFPWVEQARGLVSPAELQGLVGDLQPGVEDLAKFVDGTVQFLPAARPREPLRPRTTCCRSATRSSRTGRSRPGSRTTRSSSRASSALSGESQNFDGNGQYTRFQPGGGDQTVSTGQVPGIGSMFGNAVAAPLGTRPAMPSRRPPYNRKVACYRNDAARPELGADRTGTVKKAIRNHLRDFLAGLFLLVLALGVAGYILSNQRFYLPAWVPVVGTEFYELEAELQTAQAVVPGQGQTVNIAGVKVGEVGKVELEDGRAVVQMRPAAEVRARVSRRDDPAAAEDRAQGHVPGARPGHQGIRPDPRGRPRARREHAARREPRRGAGEPRRGHARLPAGAAERGRRGALGRELRRRPARDLQALRAHGPLRQAGHARAGGAAPQPPAGHPQLPGAVDRGRVEGQAARGARGLGERELRGARRRGGQHQGVAAAAARNARADRDDPAQGIDTSPASSGRRCSSCGPRHGRSARR